jgi:hypothetical protein
LLTLGYWVAVVALGTAALRRSARAATAEYLATRPGQEDYLVSSATSYPLVPVIAVLVGPPLLLVALRLWARRA